MISNNSKGNPNHDENGRFTSKGNGNHVAKQQIPSHKMGIDNNEAKPNKVLKLMGLTEGDLEESDQSPVNKINTTESIEKDEGKVKNSEDKKYNYIQINKDGSDGIVTLNGITPNYGAGEGGEDFEVDVELSDLMELMYDYMTPEEQEHYENEPMTPAFVNEMIEKYFEVADDKYDGGGWLFQQFVNQHEFDD